MTGTLEPPHPECAAMHKAGYCICTMVECYACNTVHPPHKLNCLPARDVVKQDPPEKTNDKSL